MVCREVEFLWCSVLKCCISHFRPIRFVSPTLFRILWHLASRECIGGTFLVARCIIKEEEAGSSAVSFRFEDVDGVFNLLEEIVGREPAITIFTCQPDNTSLT